MGSKYHEDIESILDEMEEHRIVGHKLKIDGPEEIVSTGVINHKRVQHPKLSVHKFHKRL